MTGPDSEEGFTLVEVLVSLALLAMMSAYALGALQSFRTMERVSSDFEQMAEIDAVTRNLRQMIGDARLVYRLDDNGVPGAVFSGKANTLSILSPLNDRLERGGLYVITLSHDPEQRQLTMGRRLYRPAGDGEVLSMSLLNGVERVGFRYCGTPCVEEVTDWEISDRLPSRISIDIQFTDARRRWPATPFQVRVSQ